jgi:CRP-like cAMP-binding protein
VPDSTFTAGQTLAKVPIFSGLTENELAFLAQRAVARHYSAGEVVFSESEPCSGMYVVESGHIRIFKSSSGGREHVLSVDGPGSSVAELPVFDGGTYPASASAIDDATLLFVSKQDFHGLCLAHPQVALKVLRVVGTRLRRLVGIIEELSFTTVRHRLASFLLRLAQKDGKRTDGEPRHAARRTVTARPLRTGGVVLLH